MLLKISRFSSSTVTKNTAEISHLGVVWSEAGADGDYFSEWTTHHLPGKPRSSLGLATFPGHFPLCAASLLTAPGENAATPLIFCFLGRKTPPKRVRDLLHPARGTSGHG